MSTRLIEVQADDCAHTNGHTCDTCGRQVGWDIDTDDDGRAIGAWTSFWMDTMLARYCEDEIS